MDCRQSSVSGEPCITHQGAGPDTCTPVSLFYLDLVYVYQAFECDGEAHDCDYCICKPYSVYCSREHRDVALMSLANVFHHGNHTWDAVVLMHASMELTTDLVTHLFHVGNMYSVSYSS